MKYFVEGLAELVSLGLFVASVLVIGAVIFTSLH